MDCRESKRIREYVLYFLLFFSCSISCGRIGSWKKSAVLHPASHCKLMKPLISITFSLLYGFILALVQPSFCPEME